MNYSNTSYSNEKQAIGTLAEDFRCSKKYLEFKDKMFDMPNGHFDNRDETHTFIELFLQGIKQEQHYGKFRNLKISLEVFLNLNDLDLTDLGIIDSTDKEVILKNIESHRRDPDKYKVFENHEEDLIIAKNISDQLALIQKYAALLEFKWIHQNYKDYEGDKLYSPGECLRIISKKALTQCEKTCNLIYGHHNRNHIIGDILKIHNMTMPEHLMKEKYFIWEEKKKKTKSVTVIATILIVTLGILISRKIRLFFYNQ